ncbi:hypothetical protein [Halobacteriovorax sp. HLS]|uniref:hypothetical protein n=1 Tax=Halobacteriovorax sp. HLS TaxID=2234000 RepID=UPI000FDBC2F0|nr:hypothetical protein [Halobacteriovorax sp. HLS]
MITIINDYIVAFLHPFKTHEALRHNRHKALVNLRSSGLTIADQSHVEHQEHLKNEGLSFVEVLSVSWIMAIINGIYSVGLIYLGFLTTESMSDSDAFSFLINDEISVEGQKVLISWSIIQAIFFPVTLWFYSKVWMVVVKFFGSLFNFEGDLESVSAQVVNHSIVTNVFLIVPIFGEMIRHFSSIIYLFAGLKNNMGLTTLQSLIVVCSPLFIFVLLIVLVVVYFSTLFAML